MQNKQPHHKAKCSSCGGPGLPDSAACGSCREAKGRSPLPISTRKLIRLFWVVDGVAERRRLALDAIRRLPNNPKYCRGRKLLALRHGLVDGIDHKLEELGESLDLSRERARQLEKRALRWLRANQIIGAKDLEVPFVKLQSLKLEKENDILRAFPIFAVRLKEFSSNGNQSARHSL